MRQHLDPKMVGGGDSKGASGLTGCATAYTMQVVQGRGGQLSQRNERELMTLASSIDGVVGGRLAEAGDVLMQRYKAVELASQENNWDVAQRLEIIPDARPTAVSPEERQAAANHEMAELRLSRMMTTAKGDRKHRRDGRGRWDGDG